LASGNPPESIPKEIPPNGGHVCGQAMQRDEYIGKFLNLKPSSCSCLKKTKAEIVSEEYRSWSQDRYKLRDANARRK
jgi:hypothetical protein